MIALLLVVSLPLTAMAAPSTAGCRGPKSPDGRHVWIEDPMGGPDECTTVTLYVCQYCQAQEREVVTNHNFVTDRGTPPTCTDWGSSDDVYCSRCGYVQ